MKEKTANMSSIKAGYFISPEGMITYTNGSHISAVVENPKYFGLTRKQIIDTFEKHNEKINIEGKARKEIILSLVRKGWIRIRRYPNKYWSITIWKMTEEINNHIQRWVSLILRYGGICGFEERDIYMPVRITGYDYKKEFVIGDM